MSNRWQDLEAQSAKPKVEPWMSFGVALVIAVVAVLFAAGTWVIRSGQATRAIERSAKTADELNRTQSKLAEANENISKFQDQAKQFQERVRNLELTERTLRIDLEHANAELESVRREAEGANSILADARINDAEPARLPLASLKQVVGTRPMKIYVFPVDRDGRCGLAQGEISEFTKQQGAACCGITFADDGKTALVVSVIAVMASDARVSIGVSVQIQQPWKTPGNATALLVSIWQRHTVGMTVRESAKPFVEGLIRDLLDELKSDLKK